MGKVYQTSVYNGRVRLVALDTTDIVKYLQKIHDLSPLSSVVLGRVATASLLLGSYMSENEKVTVVFNGDGPAGSVAAESGSDFKVRAYIDNKHLNTFINEKGKFDVAKAIGKGMLYVTRDLRLREPVTSNIEIISGEIAEDIAMYLNHSEQVPSAVSLGVLTDKDGIKSAGGFMLQILDQTLEEEKIKKIENIFLSLPSISTYIAENNKLEYLLDAFGEKDYLNVYESKFECSCNKEITSKALLHLNVEELEELKEKGQAEVTCNWCSKRYIFNKEEIQKIISEKLEG
ncbi:33 kDa chaperonin [Tepiditoga spiralis]|uniref:33 kDa chaperonin n=1 Tax=Tepiditoga spiralis TaxID=2108365 RepID=A0A7G1G4B9_9BACT|nr:Hsp33 family molecular chaperone HslO [Tepiditoga spiralis]BBE31201.1 33 kDa chaperonin [Tepiditoga spiralis]